MSTPDDEAVVAAAEKIARMALGDVNIEEYEALLFSTGAMLAVFRHAMKGAGYSDNLIESTAWLILTSFFGHHLTEQRIDFAPQNKAPEATTTHADEGESGASSTTT